MRVLFGFLLMAVVLPSSSQFMNCQGGDVQCTVMGAVKTCRHQRVIGYGPTTVATPVVSNATCNFTTMGTMGSVGVFYTAIASTTPAACQWSAGFGGGTFNNQCRIDTAGDGLPVELMDFSVK